MTRYDLLRVKGDDGSNFDPTQRSQNLIFQEVSATGRHGGKKNNPSSFLLINRVDRRVQLSS